MKKKYKVIVEFSDEIIADNKGEAERIMQCTMFEIEMEMLMIFQNLKINAKEIKGGE